ncbi:MAG: YraN family protein [Clostridia bacterium]|nr:YraN family protein [Clostridia bacterium]
MINSENGRLGEEIAAEFYEANGYKILCRNYRAGHNEIDIIAEKENHLVFAEVKTRTKTAALQKYGSAKSAVDRHKQKHLLDAALTYLHEEKSSYGMKPRMDVIEIYLTKEGNFLKLNYIRNAFGIRGDNR